MCGSYGSCDLEAQLTQEPDLGEFGARRTHRRRAHGRVRSKQALIEFQAEQATTPQCPNCGAGLAILILPIQQSVLRQLRDSLQPAADPE